MKDIWLIRHAESLANIGGATSTPREIPLSDNGLRQADELAEAIDARPDLIIVSPYVRTQQTAEPLILRFPDVAVETFEIQEFTYLSISRCRGTDQQQRKPWADEYWQRSDPFYSDGDQAESFVEFLERTERFVNDLREREFELACVFTHEQFIKGLLWHSMGLAPVLDTASMSGFGKFALSFKMPNASLLHGKLDDDGQFYFGRIIKLVF